MIMQYKLFLIDNILFQNMQKDLIEIQLTITINCYKEYPSSTIKTRQFIVNMVKIMIKLD